MSAHDGLPQGSAEVTLASAPVGEALRLLARLGAHDESARERVRAALNAALVATGGARARAADRLGVSRATMQRLLHLYPDVATSHPETGRFTAEHRAQLSTIALARHAAKRNA